MKQNTNDDQINPRHYKSHPSGVECIKISKHLSGCLAQSFQYLWRCGQKDDPVQELKKAIWFIRAELTITEYAVVDYDAIKDILAKVLDVETNKLKTIALASIVNANKKIGNRGMTLGAAIVAIESLISEYENA